MEERRKGVERLQKRIRQDTIETHFTPSSVRCEIKNYKKSSALCTHRKPNQRETHLYIRCRSNRPGIGITLHSVCSGGPYQWQCVC